MYGLPVLCQRGNAWEPMLGGRARAIGLNQGIRKTSKVSLNTTGPKVPAARPAAGTEVAAGV
jgi:hypothetical protein